MSTASIRKSLIISTDESARIVADVLENTRRDNCILKPTFIREESGKSLLNFLEKVR